VIRKYCNALICMPLLLLTVPAQAHLLDKWLHGNETSYACKTHHHGRFLHRCSDERHSDSDQTHGHPYLGLPTYYARKPDFYFGAKTGAFNVSSNDFEVKGMPTALLAGYGSHRLSLEMEMSSTNISLTDQYGLTPYIQERGKYDTLAVYVVHRTQGDVYFKFKGGFRRNWAITDTGKVTDENSTFGIGVGKQLGRFTMEGELTSLEPDVQFFSFGLNYKF